MNKDMPVSSHHIQDSIILLTVKIVLTIFFIETIYALLLAFFLFSRAGADYHDFVFAFLWLIHTAKFFLTVYAVLMTITPWATINYYISDNQLIKYKGLIQVDVSIYELGKIRSITLHQSWLGRLLNYGDLKIVIAASGYHEEVALNAIDNPKKYERILKEYLASAGEVK